MITKDTYIISDTHFGHENIIRFSNRPFDHEDVIFRNWSNTVGPNDTTLHLGDVMLARGRYGYHWAERIAEVPGRKLLIRGNHDHSRDIKILRQEADVELIDDFVQEFNGKQIYFSHYPDQPTERWWDINIHGHIHNHGYDPHYFPNLDPTGIYINVSIEVMDYKPVKLGVILERLKNQS